jgi:lipopolysaccharide transport system ATP-binding protein
MYVRLAFSVAAHLEPEILIVDEVLAVGDLTFQRKCLGRMKEVGRTGSTVLFVSHNMPAVETLCTRAIHLDGGRVANDGDVRQVVRDYRRNVLLPQAQEATDLRERARPKHYHRAFRSAVLLDDAGSTTSFVPLGGLFHLRIVLDTPIGLRSPKIFVGINDDVTEQRILSFRSHGRDGTALADLDGCYQVDCRVEQFPLAPGEYWLKLGLMDSDVEIDDLEQVLHFTVLDGEAFGEGQGFYRGLCIAPSRWLAVPVQAP